MNEESRTVDARQAMVENQIKSRGISDPTVLYAMNKVQRHLFVPESFQTEAYSDKPLALGYAQTISQPYIVAFMTEKLRLTDQSRVLEVGTGSGYQTAVLAELAKEVYSIEIVEPLLAKAMQTLDGLGYRNIYVRHGDGWKGWESEAPFDRILVTAAPDCVPENLLGQLSENGVMILPVGEQEQRIKILEKQNGILKETDSIAVRFVPLVKDKA